MKITTLELANVKRIKALRLVPSAKGLTIIGGNNGAGKTSVLDALTFALGGKKFRPSNLKRDGAVGEPIIRVETDNGLIIERKGKNSDLTVTDKQGARHGQALLDSLLSELAINLPKFHNSNSIDKAKILLSTLGIQDELSRLDKEEKEKADTRLVVGREKTKKESAAKDMPYYEDAPKEALSVKSLIDEQSAILARNGVKQAALDKLAHNKELAESCKLQIKQLTESYKLQIKQLKDSLAIVEMSIAEAEGVDFTMESTEELEKQIANHEEINRRVAANKEKLRREAEADALADEYDSLTADIEKIRAAKVKLLESADLPLPGLAVDNGELLYKGKAWDCMSGAEQLIVDCAIASKINPECRFVLLDKLEQLDLDTLTAFGKWLDEHDLQCIATRVSKGDECSIIIEDGEGGEQREIPLAAKPLDDDDF